MDEKEKCPRCESELISEIAGVGKRCQQCGFQFAQVRDAVGDAARRRKQEGFRGWRRPHQSER